MDELELHPLVRPQVVLPHSYGVKTFPSVERRQNSATQPLGLHNGSPECREQKERYDMPHEGVPHCQRNSSGFLCFGETLQVLCHKTAKLAAEKSLISNSLG